MAEITQVREILPYNGQFNLQVEDHDTNDIVKCLKKYHKIHGPEYDKISLPFWKGNAEKTGKHLFDFLKKNVRYDTEPEDYQTVKTPGALLHQGHGDCKHYASFITGVCDSLQRQGYPIKSKYRFVSDTPDKDIHHVFAVLEDTKQIGYPSKAKEWGADKIRQYAKDHGLRLVHGYETEGRVYAMGATGQDYWCDPVLSYFDKRPKFYNIKDTSMSIGALYHISGTNNNRPDWVNDIHGLPVIGNLEHLFNTPEKIHQVLNRHGLHPRNFKNAHHLYNFLHHHHAQPGTQNPFFPKTHMVAGAEVGNIFKDFAHSIKVNTANISKGIKVNAQNFAHGMKVNAANAKQIALNVGLSPARNAFLGLLDVNGFNMAQKLRLALLSKDRAALLNKWKSLGGHEYALINAVNNGYRHYKKGHGGYDATRDKISGVGVVQVAALVALASGIIAELAKFLKHNEVEQAQISESAKTGITDIARDVVKAGENEVNTPSQDSTFSARTGKPNMVERGSPSMSVSAGVAEDGTPTVTVHAVNHPGLPGPGGPQNGDPNDPENIPGGGNITEDLTNGIKSMWHSVTTWISDNKLITGLAVVGVVGYKYYSKPGRRPRFLK